MIDRILYCTSIQCVIRDYCLRYRPQTTTDQNIYKDLHKTIASVTSTKCSYYRAKY